MKAMSARLSRLSVSPVRLLIAVEIAVYGSTATQHRAASRRVVMTTPAKTARPARRASVSQQVDAAQSLPKNFAMAWTTTATERLTKVPATSLKMAPASSVASVRLAQSVSKVCAQPPASQTKTARTHLALTSRPSTVSLTRFPCVTRVETLTSHVLRPASSCMSKRLSSSTLSLAALQMPPPAKKFRLASHSDAEEASYWLVQ